MRCGVCGITPRTCFRTRTRTRCTAKWPPSRGRLARYESLPSAVGGVGVLAALALAIIALLAAGLPEI
jgi:hypothetical protein